MLASLAFRFEPRTLSFELQPAFGSRRQPGWQTFGSRR